MSLQGLLLQASLFANLKSYLYPKRAPVMLYCTVPTIFDYSALQFIRQSGAYATSNDQRQAGLEMIDTHRKSIWRRLKDAAVAESKELFTAVQSAEACACLQARALGVTRIRYLPKKIGAMLDSFLPMRDACNLHAASRWQTLCYLK